MAVIYERKDCKEVYVINHFKVVPFYAAFFAWQCLEVTLIPFIFRKLGLFKRYWSLKDWMINLPWLWDERFVYPKETRITLVDPFEDPYWCAYMRGYYDAL